VFRKDFPLAWHFHENTCRTGLNQLMYQPDRRMDSPFKEHLDAPVIALPPPANPDCSLVGAIGRRCSCRRFTPTPLTTMQLSTVLHSAYGAMGREMICGAEQIERPVPSGGGLYPLELYVIALNPLEVAAGIYHYQPLYHALEEIRFGSPPPQLLIDLFMSQRWVAEAAFLLVISGVVGRSLWKYEDRGYRYLLLEAGHVAQNACLVCAAMRLGALPLGGFLDHDLGQLLSLDPSDEVPLYAIAIGNPGSESRIESREPRGGFAVL
jgi:SagB-type dehydrogenase family enzyme